MCTCTGTHVQCIHTNIITLHIPLMLTFSNVHIHVVFIITDVYKYMYMCICMSLSFIHYIYRLLFLFLIALISSIIVSICTTYSTLITSSLMATILGFITSLNTLQLLLTTAGILTRHCTRLKVSSFFDSLYYSSYCCLQLVHINNFKSLRLDSLVGLLRNALLLTVSSLIIYFTVSNNGISTTIERLFHGLIISMGVFDAVISRAVQLYWCGMVRSVLHPRNKELMERFKMRRKLLYYFISVPRQFLSLYSKLPLYSM